MSQLSEMQIKTLEACRSQLDDWKNKVFRIELDSENEQIKVISKRKVMKGKGFILPYFEELKGLENALIEKFIYNSYATSVFRYL